MWEKKAMIEEDNICPHCGQPLDQWEPHPESGWDHDLLICNNDECAYFVEGRKKIGDEFRVNFGYRYCYDPWKGRPIALITWCGGKRSYLKGRCT